jgi:hypothetical protein
MRAAVGAQRSPSSGVTSRTEAILDRHLGRPAIQADISLHRGIADDHLAALLEVARKRRAETIDLDEREVSYVTPCRSGRE